VPCNWLRVSQNSTRVSYRHHPDMSSEQARDARARAWQFIFDTHRKKAAYQDKAKAKQKGLNTEGGGPHDLEEDIYAAQKV
jgi:hypothetical protein